MSLEQYIRGRLKRRPLLLMAHAVVGYPSLDDNRAMLECMQQAGIDLVELQMPFSEPIADGPAFIRANQSALAHGLQRADYFRFMREASAQFDFRLLFMGYYNSVYRMGHEPFCRALAEAGGAGAIIADLPPEQAGELIAAAAERRIDFIRLMTPTNSAPRLAEIAAGAGGFIYCVARKGVTGRHTDFDAELRAYLARCRAATRLPLAVGFGIRAPADVAQLRGVADIAVVGTACLEAWESGDRAAYLEFLRALVAAAG